MKPTRKISRRSFLGTVAGGSVAGAAAIVMATTGAEAQTTDRDTGSNADRPGHGRSGVTDSDTGANSDRPGHGRGGRRRTGLTDSDSGNGADSPGYGRGRGRRSGITDSDSGRGADSPGNGRGRRSGLTDSDSGNGADSPGNGRGRRACTDSDFGPQCRRRRPRPALLSAQGGRGAAPRPPRFGFHASRERGRLWHSCHRERSCADNSTIA